jgi:hypothetical protein
MMETIPRPPPGLYQRLLGASWDQLDETVRRFHGEGTLVRAAGTFQVRHGSRRLVRWLAWLLRLPAAAEAVEVHLVVNPVQQGEEWRRTFAGRPLVSMQTEGRGGLMAERMGLTETRFRLEVVEGALLYQSRGAALRLGPLCLPLPGWLSPRVTASEKAGAGGQVHVCVEVRLPLLGLLVSYQGVITRSEAQG